MFALINTKSGSVPQDASDQLSAALGEMGKKVEIIDPAPEEMSRALDEVLSKSPDRLIVWGGDGTIAHVLSQCGTDGPAVLPLPGGTMNLLPQIVHGQDKDWRACLEDAFWRPSEKPIPAGEVAGHRFYVGALLGNLSHMVEAREAMRDGNLFGAAQTLIQGEGIDLETSLSLIVSDKETTQLEATLAVAMIETVGDTVRFEIGAIDPDTQWDLVRAAFTAIMLDWREAGGVEHTQTATFNVSTTDGDDIYVTLDGEPSRIPNGSQFQIIPDAAKVWTVA